MQLVEILRAQIDSGALAENRPIPSKKALQQEYGLAQGTIEHALQVLKDDGYIKTVIGLGLFVVPARERSRR